MITLFFSFIWNMTWASRGKRGAGAPGCIDLVGVNEVVHASEPIAAFEAGKTPWRPPRHVYP